MRNDYNLRPVDHRYTDTAKHKEEQGVGGSEGNTQSKGIANQKGRKGGAIKREKANINFPKMSDSQYKSEL